MMRVLRTIRDAGTARLCSAVILSVLFVLVPVWAQAQTKISDGPAEPAWQIGFPGVPHTFQQDDRDFMFPFSWGWYGEEFEVVTTDADYSASGLPEGEVFNFQVPPAADTIITDLDLANPTGFSISPHGDSLWIADYGANQVLRYDFDLDTIEVIHDGNDAGSPLDGPWDIQLAYFSSTETYPDNTDDWVLSVYVTSRDNNRIYRMSLDGEVVGTYSTSGLREPTELYCYESLGTWPNDFYGWACINMYVASFGGNRLYRFIPSGRSYSDCPNRFCSDNWPSISKPMGITTGPSRYGLLVSSYDTGEIVTPGYNKLTTVVSSAAGLNHPTSIFTWETTHDVLGATHEQSYWREGYRPEATQRLYILDSDNERISWWDWRDPNTVEPYLDDPDGVDRVALFRGEFNTSNGDFYALDIDDVTGLSSITLYPGFLDLTVETLNAPQEAVLGVSAEGFFSRTYRSWLFDDAVGGDRITIPVYRDRLLNFHLGFTDPAAAAPVDIRAQTSLRHNFPRPVLDASPGATDNAIVVTVDTVDSESGMSADEVILYELTGCSQLVAVSAASLVNPYSYYRFPYTTQNLKLTMGDIDECGVEIERVEADPSGTTTFDLDIEFPATARYCFFAVQRDLDTNTYSNPSRITDVESCARPDVGGVEALFCQDSLEAHAYDPAVGYQLNHLSDPGQPTWFEYTVSGQPDEERVIFAWVNQPLGYNDPYLSPDSWANVVDGGEPLITIFDDCPTEGGGLLAEDHWAVSYEAHGGDVLQFRVSHFEQLNPTWMLLDLSKDPTTELAAPANLSASTDVDGAVELCWDSDVELQGVQIHSDYVYFKILRGPVGGPVDEVLESGWRQRCYRDLNLGPNASYDYQVATELRMRALTHQLDPLIVESAPTEVVTGQTSGVDVTGDPLVVPRASNLEVSYVDHNDHNFFLSAGTLIWWDSTDIASEHRVEQTLLNTGVQTSFILAGGARAAEIPPDELGRYCYDVYARRENGAGVMTESLVHGYSEAGDPRYCMNLCEEAPTYINMGGTGPGGLPIRGIGSTASALVLRPIEYFEVNVGGYTGLFHLTNASGNAARVCAWQGESTCDNLTFLGCANPNAAGNTSMDFVIENGDLPVYVMWEVVGQGGLSYEDLHTFQFTVGFAKNLLPENESPSLAINVADNTCSSRVLIDFLAENWEPVYDSYISFRVGGIEVATTTELVGTLALDLDPLEALHEIEAIIFENPLESILKRRIYTTAGPTVGDINEDCSLDVADVVLLIRHILGLAMLNDKEQQVANFVSEQPAALDMLDVVGMVTNILDSL